MTNDELRLRVTLIMFDVGFHVKQIAELLTALDEAGLEIKEKESADGETEM